MRTVLKVVGIFLFANLIGIGLFFAAFYFLSGLLLEAPFVYIILSFISSIAANTYLYIRFIHVKKKDKTKKRNSLLGLLASNIVISILWYYLIIMFCILWTGALVFMWAPAVCMSGESCDLRTIEKQIPGMNECRNIFNIAG